MNTYTATILLIFLSVAGLPAQVENTDGRGIMIFYRYQFADPWGDLLDNPVIAGGRKQAYWAEVNPEQGAYDWQSFDDALQTAHKAGKKVGLIVSLGGYGGWQNPFAANGVPDWVYALGDGKGVDYLEWDGPPYTRYPVFWSDTIKSHFQTFIETFGDRYDGHPDLEYVIIGLYPEMNLGKDANSLQQEWLDAGYSDDLYESTVKWYIDLYAENFPGTQLSLACFSSKPIKLMSNARFEDLRDNVSAHMDSIPNGGIENNALWQGSNWDFIQQWFRKHHTTTHILYEAVDKSSGGGRAGNFRRMLENGLTAHADHFQIYYEDVRIATPGQDGYDPEYEAAISFAAQQIGLEPGDPERDNVWLRFNALDKETGSGKFYFQGLYCDANAPKGGGEWPAGKPRPPDGEYMPVAGAGLPVRECVKTNLAAGDNYIYLDVDDHFMHGGMNHIEIRVEYLDEGTDGFIMEYDGSSGVYTQTEAVIKANSGTWKTASLQIGDAALTNAQAGENDLRLNCLGDGDEYISFIQIRRTENVSTVGHTKDPSSISVFPNPTAGILSIQPGIVERVEIYNASGTMVKVIMNSARADLDGQPRGLYLLRIRTAAGCINKKIILE